MSPMQFLSVNSTHILHAEDEGEEDGFEDHGEDEDGEKEVHVQHVVGWCLV